MCRANSGRVSNEERRRKLNKWRKGRTTARELRWRQSGEGAGKARRIDSGEQTRRAVAIPKTPYRSLPARRQTHAYPPKF